MHIHVIMVHFRHSEVGGVFVMYTLWDAMVMVLDPKHIQVFEFVCAMH